MHSGEIVDDFIIGQIIMTIIKGAPLAFSNCSKVLETSFFLFWGALCSFCGFFIIAGRKRPERSKGAFGRATEGEHIERHSDTSGANKTGGKRPMRSKGAKAKGWVGDLAAMRTWEGIPAKTLKHLNVCRRAAKTTHTPPPAMYPDHNIDDPDKDPPPDGQGGSLPSSSEATEPPLEGGEGGRSSPARRAGR